MRTACVLNASSRRSMQGKKDMTYSVRRARDGCIQFCSRNADRLFVRAEVPLGSALEFDAAQIGYAAAWSGVRHLDGETATSLS